MPVRSFQKDRVAATTKEQRQALGEKSGSRAPAESHVMSATQCPLYPQKWTFRQTQPRAVA